MNRLGLAALVVVAASAAPASAGTYVGLGIGTGASASASNGAMLEENGRSGRALIGWRLGRLAVEGAGTRYDYWGNANPYTATQLAAALKLGLPLGNNFEFFGRGGLHRTWFNQQNGDGDDAGNGYLLGGGFEYRLNLGVTGASVFVDYQRSSVTLVDDRMAEVDVATSMWTLGLTVSI